MVKNQMKRVYDGHRHIVLFGKKGSGKTTLFSNLVDHNEEIVRSTGHDAAIGLCRLGQLDEPVVLIDTAELNGAAELEATESAEKKASRLRRMHDIIRRADLAIYITDIQEFDQNAFLKDKAWLDRNMIPYLMVFNCCDDAERADIVQYKVQYPQALFLSANEPEAISLMRMTLAQMIRTLKRNETPLVPENLVKKGDYVIVLMKNNGSEAPRFKKNLIPELVSRGVHCVISTQDNLEQLIQDLPHIGLIVTFARNFESISTRLPEEIPLTSYSMLYGKQCGQLETFAEGARAIRTLDGNSRVLVVSGSDYAHTSSDTGRIKIPRQLRHAVGEALRVDHLAGGDLPEDLEKYDLVVHYLDGSITQRTVCAHVAQCREAGVPIASYGTVLAELAGILDRCMTVFDNL